MQGGQPCTGESERIQLQMQQQLMTHQQEAPAAGRAFASGMPSGGMPPPPGAVSGIGMRSSMMPSYGMPQYAPTTTGQSADMAGQHHRQDGQWFGQHPAAGYIQPEGGAAASAVGAAGGYSQTVYTVPPGSMMQAPAGYMPQQFGAPLLRTVRPGMIGAMAGMAPRPGAGLGIQKESAKRVTVWNKKENRKISGNAAPMEKNLHDYLRKHPECEVYSCQDKESRAMDSVLVAGIIAGMGGTSEDDKGSEKRITIWNKRETRKISGNAAPLEKNLWSYLRDHPEYEVYNGQDKRPEEFKRVWKQDGDDKEISPGMSMEILGGNGKMRGGGEFSFKDHFGTESSPGSWDASVLAGAATPWGIQLAGAGSSPQTEAIPIDGQQMSGPRDGDADMMMFDPSSLGSMGSAPGSMGSIGHLGSIGSSVGSVGLYQQDGQLQSRMSVSMSMDEDDL